jgi:hypothetical protein
MSHHYQINVNLYMIIELEIYTLPCIFWFINIQKYIYIYIYIYIY